jgi:hypothetical protein
MVERVQRTSSLQRVSLVSAGLVAVVLVGGLKSLLAVLQGLGFHNWLVLLFQINAGQVDYATLRVLNPLDLLILILVAMTFIGLWPSLARGRKIWISIAIAQPLLGIVLLLATHLLGRSAVMGGGLVISILMLRAEGFKVSGWLGIIANSLLLVSDFGTTGSPAPLLAAAAAAGYLLLLAWYVSIAGVSWKLLRTPSMRIEPAAQDEAHPSR